MTFRCVVLRGDCGFVVLRCVVFGRGVLHCGVWLCCSLLFGVVLIWVAACCKVLCEVVS